MKTTHQYIISTLLSFTLCFGHIAQANLNKNLNIWSTFRYKWKIHNNEIVSRVQSRYSFNNDAFYKERIGLNYFLNTSSGKWGALLTFGTLHGFTLLDEIRYALEWTSIFSINSRWDYTLRLRQEVRDFSKIHPLLYRFRLRNSIIFKPNPNKNWKLSLSSEPNIYLNESSAYNAGLSSHRTIFSYTQSQSMGQWNLSLIHDYGESKLSYENKYILSVGFDLVH